jgi:hypothetical protein
VSTATETIRSVVGFWKLYPEHGLPAEIEVQDWSPVPEPLRGRRDSRIVVVITFGVYDPPSNTWQPAFLCECDDRTEANRVAGQWTRFVDRLWQELPSRHDIAARKTVRLT